MIDFELDPIIEQIARDARRSVAVSPDAKDRLLAAVRAEPAPGTADYEMESGVHRRSTVTLTATRFAAVAASLVGLGALLGLQLSRDSQSTRPPTVTASTPKLPASSSDTVVTFVFVAHNATRVSVVGDFNQWNADSTPMQRIGNSSAWTVTLPLAAGRHLYSFLAVGAEGEKWAADPYAPAAPDDGFGRVNSVVLVGKGSTS